MYAGASKILAGEIVLNVQDISRRWKHAPSLLKHIGGECNAILRFLDVYQMKGTTLIKRGLRMVCLKPSSSPPAKNRRLTVQTMKS